MILAFLCIFLFILYAALVLYYWYLWKKVPEAKKSPVDFDPTVTISVIIPARNEQQNIGVLLDALSVQAYPKELIEIVVVDDHSTDQTAAIVKNYPTVKLVSLHDDIKNSYKKKAIDTGIRNSSGELIVSTDADCTPAIEWLSGLADRYQQEKPVFIAAPVVIDCNSSILQVFQAIDFMVLQVITGAVVHHRLLSMCNGANIAYTRKAFNEVNGFTGIDHIASGDDMLLMYKIWKAHPESVVYLKSKHAIVSTQPQSSWKSFFHQRIRWASKASGYQDKRFFPVLLLVWLFNFSFLVFFVAGFFNYDYWLYLLGMWVGKTLAELPLFISAANFFNKRWAIRLFFFFQPLHIAYTIISGLFGQMGKYEWKGRRVR